MFLLPPFLASSREHFLTTSLTHESSSASGEPELRLCYVEGNRKQNLIIAHKDQKQVESLVYGLFAFLGSSF